jgi:hypothetical protein
MSKPEFIVVHRVDKNNVGDMASNPLRYFKPDGNYLTVDVGQYAANSFSSDIPVIVGGGGLIGNELFEANLRKVCTPSDINQLNEIWKKKWDLSDPDNLAVHTEFTEKFQTLIAETKQKVSTKRSLRVIWGAGINTNGYKKKGSAEWPDWMSDFDLVGIRDWAQPHPWVPCASCMSPAFDKQYTQTNDIIIFEHKKQLINEWPDISIPRFVNSGNNLEQTIALLGSAKTVITNSYHGVYWATLLGKKVICIGAWSSKFAHYRHRPTFINNWSQLEEAIETTMPHLGALEESRQANKAFWEKIKRKL